MKAFKLGVLLLVTVFAMRLMSWALAWLLMKKPRMQARIAALLSNVSCFATFVIWVYIDLKPYGGIEPSVIIFGAIVFGGCLFLDLTRIRRKSQSRAAVP